MPHPRAAAGQVTSHLCLRPQGEFCHPNAMLDPGISASVPKEHNLGQPRFLGGATFPDCFLTGETHPPHRHRQPAPKVCSHRLMSQTFPKTPIGLREGPRTASVCLVNSEATPKFKLQSHWTTKAQTIMNKSEWLQRGKNRQMHNHYLCFSLATECKLWFRHT